MPCALAFSRMAKEVTEAKSTEVKFEVTDPNAGPFAGGVDGGESDGSRVLFVAVDFV